MNRKPNPHTSRTTRAPLALAVAMAILLPAGAQADALISSDLQSRLASTGVHEVIVTFSDRSQMSRLSTLTTKLRLLKELPMAGAVLTSAQVKQVAAWPGVESIYFNAPLKYFNYGAGEYTGADGKRMLRSYGSMTYAGLKSMIFAGVGPDDPRVKAAYLGE